MNVKQRLIIPNLIKYEYDTIIFEENPNVITSDTKMTHAIWNLIWYNNKITCTTIVQFTLEMKKYK
jgi:hypothetical protein